MGIQRRTLLRVFLVLAPLHLGACSNVDSEDIKTSGIHAKMDIIAEGDGTTRVTAVLTAGNGVGASYVDLSNGDRLRATAGGQSRVLAKDGGGLARDIEYQTLFDFDSPNTVFTVALERDNDSDAPASTVVLPETFDFTAPAAGTAYGDTDTMEVTWSPSNTGQGLFLTVTVECPLADGAMGFGGTMATSADDGNEAIALAPLVAQATADGRRERTGACGGLLHASRSANGDVDPNYGSGRITAHQRRSLSFVINGP